MTPTAWHNPILTLDGLADMAHVSEHWLRDILRSDDPFPTLQRSKHVRVLWSDYVEWEKARYGDGAPLRGTEVIYTPKTARQKKAEANR